MKLGTVQILGGAILALILAITSQAQQDTSGIQQNAGQASQPAASSNGAGGRVESDMPSATQSAGGEAGPAPGTTAPTQPATTSEYPTGSDDNPYDPILEPPPLPKGKATLIGGIATSVDHVRNRITIQPFGKGQKLKIVVDERSHIYRNGTPTTVLGIHKGDRVYVDTLLDRSNDKILAKNVRVVTDTGLAEVRGQVIATNPGRDTVTVRDMLSAKPVTFSVGSGTNYSSTKGTASARDVQPGALIDVQFSPRHSDRDIARAITIVAEPGDNYIFSGVVTNLDMRTDSLFVDNTSDDQSYELHFAPADVADLQQLKVGSEVTARAVFDGKQYKASNIRVDNSPEQPGEQSKAQ
jgi:hypothetical protein